MDSNAIEKRKKQVPKYIPPLNFSPVISREVLLYRSGFPMPINYEFIRKQLHIKTVIYLGNEKEIADEYTAFLASEKINFVFVPMESCRDPDIDEKLRKVLLLVLNVDNYPMLIHSNKGKHRVGLVVGLIRKLLQGWSMAGVYQEYGLFSGGLKDDADLEFITMFECDLLVDRDKIPKFVQLEEAEGDTETTDER